MSNDLFPAGELIDTKMADLEAFDCHTPGWDLQFIKIGTKDLRTTLNAFHTPHLQLSTSYYTDAYLLQGRTPKNAVLLAYIDSEEICNFKHKKLRKNDLIVSRHQDNFDLLTAGSSSNYSIAIEEGLFSSYFELFFDLNFQSVIEKIHFCIKEDQEQAFMDKITEWIHFFNHAKELEFTLPEYFQLERQIIGSIFSFLEIRSYQHNESNVERARVLLEENLKNTYYIKDLVEELRVNERSLQKSFKNHLGISAKHYLKQLRLHAIRQELISLQNREECIKEIAMKYNFFHMGHFTDDYKKLFFETPSETVKNY